MASTDFRDNLDSKDFGTANQILDQFERDVVAGVPVLIEHVRDNVEAHLRRYVVKSCVSIEIEQANSVTDEKLSDYLRRFPEYKTELLDVFKTWQEKIIAGFGDTIPLPAPNVEPTPLNINQESAIADSPFPFLLNGENYNFIRRIGGGGFADVYIGHSIPLNQDVAIKVIKERVSKDEQSTAANSREIEILRRMNHPGVVRLFEVRGRRRGKQPLSSNSSGVEPSRNSGLRRVAECRFNLHYK
jgi:serine/threonine protein kinase